MRARIMVALGAVGLVTGASGMVWATGATAPTPAPLGGFDIEARAPGFEMTYDEPAAQTHPEGQGTVPQTLSQLKTGPVGFAQAAIAWPGTLLGNSGDTIIAAGGSNIPSSEHGTVHQFNDPVRSESRVGEGSPDNSYTGAPGSTMTTHADAARTEANANVRSLASPGGSAGSIASASKSTLDNNIGVAQAKSTVSNVVLGPANVITIDSVTSTATATTDGTTAKASGSTVVSGMKIAGQPATVDEHGVRFGPAKDPVNDRLNKLAQQALSSAGFTIILTKPEGAPSGSSVTYNAGSLVMKWEPQPKCSSTPVLGARCGDVISVTLGGATVIVSSSPASDVGSLGAITTPAAPGGSESTGGSAGVSSVSTPTGGSTGSPSSGSISTPAVPVATRPILFFGGVPFGWVFLGMAGAALAAVGLRKLSTDVLAEQAAVCSLERKTP